MGYEVVKIYEDEVSGAKSREKRPAYSKLCKDAFLKRFDIIIGWDVSRFSRSLKEFVHFLSDMDDKGSSDGSHNHICKRCKSTQAWRQGTGTSISNSGAYCWLPKMSGSPALPLVRVR